MFSVTDGFALAELEFPIYFNFFVKKCKTRIVCSEDQRRRLEIVLSEALFGPEDLDIIHEFVEGEATPGFPDFRAEMDYFRRMPMASDRLMVLEDLVDFSVFDKSGKTKFGEIEIQRDPQYNFCIFEHGKKIADIHRTASISDHKVEVPQQDLAFRPPLFGMTTLGAGHGFDPDASTSGMILWLNRRGIMIDPPANSTQNLLDLGVSPKLGNVPIWLTL